METSEEETTVRLVDYGYMKTVQDSQCLRELPEEWRHFMTMAVELELGVIPIEENQDVLNALSIFGFVCNLQDCDLSLFLCFVVLILLFNPITSSRSHVSYATVLPHQVKDVRLKWLVNWRGLLCARG